MSETRILQKKSLGELFAKLTAAGQRLLAPVKEGELLNFAEVKTPEHVALDYIQTRSSAKLAAFPPYEPLLRYKFNGKDVEQQPAEPDKRPTVLFGAHPCDAASFATL
ncbi:MAG: hypothetical protein KBH81_10500, partial [Phycisphaerae bacterium]|nr:hypothetical protein [Phycisphaerae bacterium]